MCVALVGYADMSASFAATKDGAQPVGEEAAAKSEHSSKTAVKKTGPAVAKPAAKSETTAATKTVKKPAPAATHKAEKKPAAAASHKSGKKPVATSPEKKPEPAIAAPVEKAPEPVAAPSVAPQPAPVADKPAELTPAKKKSSWWWPFGGDDKTAEQKPAQVKAAPQAPVEVKKPEPKPVSKAWLDDNEKRLRSAVAGSKFEVERRGDMLVVVAPADGSFNPDRPNMLLPITLGPLSKVAKQAGDDAQSAVLVLGHGDGNSEADRKLTTERAQAVASIFRMSGLKGDRLMLRGMGADQPRASNDNPKGRAQNRRVEVILTQRDHLPALMVQGSH